MTKFERWQIALICINQLHPLYLRQKFKVTMGKGDKKTKKGKRFKASFGNARKRTAITNRLKRNAPKAAPVATGVVEEKPKAEVKRAPRKKAESAE